MTFAEAEKYILSLSNLPRQEYMRDPKHCGVYLQRLQFFLGLVGNPEKKVPHYIHVTGTSGKGSTVSFLHSILHAAGKTVGSTYSPHPTVITERWKIGKRYMTKSEFTRIVGFLKPKLDEYIRTSPYDMISFFELTEVIGFVWFAEKKVDWVILEVACGGRYDSTNVIPHKDAAIITNIGLDHVGLIGNNKSEIAYEKAGIIKPGCRAFTLERNPQVRRIIATEAKKQKVTLGSIQHPLENVQYSLQGTSFSYGEHTYSLGAIGPHQAGNAALCIEVAESLGIETSFIQKGLRDAEQPLRMEIVSQNPFIILDGAHNEDKIHATVESVRELQKKIKPSANIHLLLGFSGDKEIKKMLKDLATLNPKTVACSRNTVNHFRKVASPPELKKLLTPLLPKAHMMLSLDPHVALAWSQKQLKKNDILLVTGSIFLSGELRPLFKAV